jgi:hypothetical protein
MHYNTLQPIKRTTSGTWINKCSWGNTILVDAIATTLIEARINKYALATSKLHKSKLLELRNAN